MEKEYFGLCYQDKGGDRLWVNLRNPLSEQLPQGNHVVMEMRVKYFIPPHKILQPVTRYHNAVYCSVFTLHTCVCENGWRKCNNYVAVHNYHPIYT